MPALIDPRGFDRHTFLCGQSGSGKTYSLGVILEHLLVESGLRVLVLDPELGLCPLRGRCREDSNDPISRGLPGRSRPASRSSGSPVRGLLGPLRIRVSELSPPLALRCFNSTLSTITKSTPHLIRAARPRRSRSAFDRRHQRACSPQSSQEHASWVCVLRISECSTGASGREVPADHSTGASSHDDWRCLVVDLGSLDTPEEQAVIAESVLETLWRPRHDRQARPDCHRRGA